MIIWFKFKKLKKWFKWQVIIKKSIIKTEEFKMIVKIIIKRQRVIKENIKHEASFKIIIINNIFV